MIKKLGHALIIPFSEYIKAKDAWISQHPKATILEEIKNLTVGVGDVPDTRHIGRTVKRDMLMIIWAIVYEEEIEGELPAMANGQILITASADL